MAQLCNLEDIRLRLQDTPSMSAAQSGSYTACINDASDFAETYCSKTFLSGSLESETFDGQGFVDNIPAYHVSQPLQHKPISSSPVLKLYLWDGDSWESVDDYEVDTDNGIVYFPGTASSEYYRQPGYVSSVNTYFVKGTNNYKAEYYYGYDGVANLPSDLRGAIARHAIFLYNTTTQLGTVSNSSADGRSYAYDPKLPASILRVYDKYK